MRSLAYTALLAALIGCDDGADGAPEVGMDAGPRATSTRDAQVADATRDADAGRTDGGDPLDSGAADTGPPCTHGESSCVGEVWHSCRYGNASESDCSDRGRFCVDQGSGGLQGCYDCDPARFGGSCDGDDDAGVTATYCAANGEIHQRACDECVDGCCDDEDGDGVRGCDGDCNDDNASVFPGQTEYFSTGYGTLGFEWDYDCNGERDQEHTRTGACGCCWLPPNAVVPSCGRTGKFRFCQTTGSPDGTETQRCR